MLTIWFVAVMSVLGQRYALPWSWEEWIVLLAFACVVLLGALALGSVMGGASMSNEERERFKAVPIATFVVCAVAAWWVGALNVLFPTFLLLGFTQDWWGCSPKR